MAASRTWEVLRFCFFGGGRRSLVDGVAALAAWCLTLAILFFNAFFRLLLEDGNLFLRGVGTLILSAPLLLLYARAKRSVLKRSRMPATMSCSDLLPSMVVLLSFALVSCGSSGAQPTDAGGGGCNELANNGQTISRTATASAPPDTPSFTGGVIADGTYVLTAMLDYASATPLPGTRKETFVFTGGDHLQAVFSVDGAPDETYSATLSMTGGYLTIATSCNHTQSVALNTTTAYTATATDFRVLTGDGSGNTTEVSTYTKQ